MAFYARLLLAGWGIYAANFMLWALLYGYGFWYGLAPQLVTYVVTAGACIVASLLAPVDTWKRALLRSAVWLALYIALDIVFLVPSVGIVVALQPSPFALIAYALVALVPLAAYLLPAARG